MPGRYDDVFVPLQAVEFNAKFGVLFNTRPKTRCSTNPISKGPESHPNRWVILGGKLHIVYAIRLVLKGVDWSERYVYAELKPGGMTVRLEPTSICI